MAAFALFRQVTFWSLLAGLCPLIPIPFLDDWILGRVTRRMFREVAAATETEVAPEAVALLAGAGEGRWPGCLGTLAWVLRSVLLRLVRKLFRTVLYFLAVRQGIHQATEVFHQGYLFLVAVERPPEAAPVPLTAEDVRRVRAATRATLAEVEVKPIRRAMRRAFWSSIQLLIEGSRLLGSLFRRRRDRQTVRAGEELPAEEEVLAREEALLGGTIDRLARVLWGDRAYFAHLDAVFRRRLAETAAPTPPGPAP